jgi:hypothetical protein
MLIAYLPTIGKLRKLERNFDSTIQWVTIFAGSIVATIPAVIDWDRLAIFNSIRAVLASAFTLYSMLRLDAKAIRNGNFELK